MRNFRMCDETDEVFSSLTPAALREALAEVSVSDESARGVLHLAEDNDFVELMPILDSHVDGFDRDGFSPGDAGRALERELRSLLCSKSAKYQEVRNQFRKAHRSVKDIGIAIASVIAAEWHLSVGLLTPFVLAFLLGALQVGKNAWCSGTSVASIKTKRN
jgi:hypothetical protein